MIALVVRAALGERELSSQHERTRLAARAIDIPAGWGLVDSSDEPGQVGLMHQDPRLTRLYEAPGTIDRLQVQVQRVLDRAGVDVPTAGWTPDSIPLSPGGPAPSRSLIGARDEVEVRVTVGNGRVDEPGLKDFTTAPGSSYVLIRLQPLSIRSHQALSR
ncbi:hypothetical protein [Motilibacter deserti]|uniref:Uncharacterized protein n=1 Tax=Motilibacter deserti TaxID=2714956 RepID=A0ABX0GWH8_9ACTN|nr:hypothetical protein [Motilibacter deserti]NHC15157.1 hypothetical protein [Motilibacter deserti]